MSATVPMRDGKSNPKLLDQVRDAIRRKHYSLRSERTYRDWIERALDPILFQGLGRRHPEMLTPNRMREIPT